MSDPASMFNFSIPVADAPVLADEVRNNFEALARAFYTTDTNYPETKRKGMPRIFDNGGTGTDVLLQWWDGSAWVTILRGIQKSIATPTRVDMSFASALTWTLNHYMGVYPLVQVYDAAGNLINATNYTLQHVNNDRVVITFSAPTAGSAILIG